MTPDPTVPDSFGSPSVGRRPEDRLADLGLTLPDPFPPAAAYVAVRVEGATAYVSGHGPMLHGKVQIRGKVGLDLTEADGYEAAKLTCLNVLASLKAHLGQLSRIRGFLKLLVLVNATEDFEHHPHVADGASDLILAVFGPGAVHARSAIGVASLPFSIATEVEAVVAID
ncbi:MAG: RidA family protein [Bifidobacteriaceae bacterium]|jgi:enamine deaminase RidA (YjgF/YER057c/UK114 family)|nr:RidA family protein [Bifidobacteriaceae bacterium]